MTKSRSEKEKPLRRRGGHLSPPDRMCEFCYNKMPPAETVEACTGCLGQWKRMQVMRQQIHTVFEVTKTMTLDAIFKVLWDFKWKHR